VPLPQAWVDMIRGKATPLHRSTAATVTPLTGPACDRGERGGVVEGLRNTTLAAYVGRWITQRHPENEIRQKAFAFA